MIAAKCLALILCSGELAETAWVTYLILCAASTAPVGHSTWMSPLSSMPCICTCGPVCCICHIEVGSYRTGSCVLYRHRTLSASTPCSHLRRRLQYDHRHCPSQWALISGPRYGLRRGCMHRVRRAGSCVRCYLHPSPVATGLAVDSR